MKAVVVACLEPERLDLCLDALLRWLPAEDVLVIDNANTPERSAAINRVALRWGVLRGRTHDFQHGENTLLHIHEAIKGAAEMWPGETILKIDEDVLLVSRPELWDVGQHELLIPAITVNNYTTRFFLEELDPDLNARTADHAWMWHMPHPLTGEETKTAAFEAIYGADPRVLAKMCQARGTVTRLTHDDWTAQTLMDEGQPGADARRGISSMCVAFRADDYLDMCGAREGIEEVLLAEAVYAGRATYVVDTSIFCHHISYHSIRERVGAMGEPAEAYHRRALLAMDSATRALAPA